MTRAFGEVNFGDITGKGLSDSVLANMRPQVPVKTDPATGQQYCPVDPEEYGGPDCDTQELLQDASKALQALSALLKLSSSIADAKMRADFEKAVKDAQNKIIDGQNKMIDASNKINEASNGLYNANQQINSLASQLSSIQNSISLELANISSIANTIAGIDSRISSASNDLASAQARFDNALNRANYAPGFDGLKQQRNDLRSANNDIFNLNSTIADLQNTKGQAVFDMNQAGDRYNNLIPQANAVRDGVADAYKIAGDYQTARDGASQQFNDGAGTIRGGYGDLMSAGKTYQDFQNNVLMPMTEGATGASGLSKALQNISQGNNFTAVGDVMNAGLESGLRNGGNATLNQFGGLWGSTISEVSKSLDQTIKSNGDMTNFFQNVANNTGNKLLGVNNFIQVGQGANEMYNFLKYGDTSGAGSVFADKVVPNAVEGTAKVAGTVLPFTPLAPVTPLVATVEPMVQTASQGLTRTLVEVGQVSLSQDLTPRTPRTGPGERGLYENGANGKPGALTVGLAGMTITAYETARSGVASLIMQDPQRGLNASVAIQNMAHSGTSPAGSVNTNLSSSLRVGDVQLRPPSAIPVSIGTTIGAEQ